MKILKLSCKKKTAKLSKSSLIFILCYARVCKSKVTRNKLEFVGKAVFHFLEEPLRSSSGWEAVNVPCGHHREGARVTGRIEGRRFPTTSTYIMISLQVYQFKEWIKEGSVRVHQHLLVGSRSVVIENDEGYVYANLCGPLFFGRIGLPDVK